MEVKLKSQIDEDKKSLITSENCLKNKKKINEWHPSKRTSLFPYGLIIFSTIKENLLKSTSALCLEAKLKIEDKIKRNVLKIWLKTLNEKAKLKTEDYWQHLKIFQRKKNVIENEFCSQPQNQKSVKNMSKFLNK